MDHGGAMETDQESLNAYRDELRELITSDKPRINMLTMLAEENQQQGAALVTVIKDHIFQVRIVWGYFPFSANL